jgi:beta-lactamase regulating signal transducer with metallopeptidase domain
MIERAIALLLINALWEPVAIAVCAFAVLRIASRANAATRCAVLTAAIAASLVLPAITTAVVYRAAPSQVTISSDVSASHTIAKPAHSTVPARDTSSTATSPAAAPAVQRPVFTVPPQAVLAVVVLWGAIALVFLARLLISLAHLGRLRRDALPISPDLRAQLRRWSEKAAGIEVRLCLSDETVVPIAVGLFDCMVLIPRRLLEELEPADLDRIVLHEIAHLRRRDGIVYAVQQLAAALYFFSPGVLWLSKTLDVEREVACDDWVLERSADAAPYANCLVRLAEGVPWPHKALAAPGAFVTRHSMSIRIERILQHARDARLRAAPAPVIAALATAGVVAAVGLSFAPSLAYPVVAKIAAPVKPAHVAHVVAAKRVAAKPVAVKPVTPRLVATRPVAAHVAAVKPTAAARPTTAVKPVKASPKRVVPALPKRTFVELPALVANANPDPAPSADYIDQMRRLFGNVSVDDLVSLKSVGVTSEYVQQLRNAGLTNLRVHDVIAARASGLTPERIARYHAAFGTVSLDDMIAMASMNVDTAYRDQLQAAGLKDLTARRLIELKSVGVTPDYIRQVGSLGFGPLSGEQIVELKSMEIDKAYIERVRAHGFNNLTLRQLIELKASGVIK